MTDRSCREVGFNNVRDIPSQGDQTPKMPCVHHRRLNYCTVVEPLQKRAPFHSRRTTLLLSLCNDTAAHLLNPQ
jgi:hypothetical protein